MVPLLFTEQDAEVQRGMKSHNYCTIELGPRGYTAHVPVHRSDLLP